MRLRSTVFTGSLAFFLLVFLLPTLAFSESVVMTDSLDLAKQAFSSIAQRAAENSKRKADLEKSLVLFAGTVEKAKSTLAESEAQKRDVRSRIAEHKELIVALHTQIDALQESKNTYASLVAAQRSDLVSFVRYVSLRQMEIVDTGPVIGRSILQHLLRGSLGDLVDQDLGRQALLDARQQFLADISLYMSENDKALARLQDMQTQMTTELQSLIDTYTELQHRSEQSSTIIDTSWRQKILTEQELADVQSEWEESNTQVIALQQDLLAINRKLQARRIAVLQKDLTAAGEEKVMLDAQARFLQEKSDRLHAALSAKTEAFTRMMSLVNTDPSQYRRVADLKHKIDARQNVYAQATEELTLLGKDPSRVQEFMSKTAEVAGILVELHRLQDKMDLLRKGVPDATADDYLSKDALAQVAQQQLVAVDAEQKKLAQQLQKNASRIADTQAKISLIQNQPFDIPTLAGLSVSGSPFVWPVRGSVTAGFHDIDYYRVFHVQHQAVDIATKQGTPVHVTADGVVFHVKLGGAKGYTYVLVGHQHGYASLYGHLSTVLVKDGEVVSQGQVIGLSGGLPGTDGAGPMTTGAHLHFEMTKNGIHFNPLDALGS